MKRNVWYLSRRTLLRTAGVTVALPALEAMVKPGAYAQTANTAPRRFLAIHGQIYGYIGKADPDFATNVKVAPWTAQARGYSVPLENNTYLRPFFTKGIQSKVTVLTGLTDRVLIGTHDSPIKLVANTFPVAMYRGGCVVLTRTPGPTNTVGPPPKPDPFNGATTDQIAARHLGKFTPVPYLSLAVETVGGNSSFTMSNKSSTDPIPADRDPKSVFDRLFKGYDANATADEITRRKAYRSSVLDAVREDANRLKSRLGKSDAQKLDGYLESIRGLEKLIEEAMVPEPSGTPLTPPGTATSYANKELVQKAMQGLIAQAFITDRTRVVAFSYPYPGKWLKYRSSTQKALDYSKYRQFAGTPFSGSHHTMSHYDQGINGSAPSPEITAQKKDWMEIFSHWSLDMYSELLAELDKHMDSDGKSTVLDNTISIYGGDNSDSAKHGYLSQPCIIGGRGGATASGAWRILSGRQLRFADYGGGTASERSWKDLLWGALNIVGVPDPDGSPRLKYFGYAKNPLDVELGK